MKITRNEKWKIKWKKEIKIIRKRKKRKEKIKRNKKTYKI
jgi:hypothetical protein